MTGMPFLHIDFFGLSAHAVGWEGIFALTLLTIGLAVVRRL